MVDLNSLCTFVLGGRVGGGRYGGGSRQSSSRGPSLLYIPLLVFWPVFSLEGKEAQAGKMLETCKHEKFPTGFAKFL